MVGSSKHSNSGVPLNPIATSKRLLCPPDNLLTFWSLNLLSPVISNNLLIEMGFS